MKNKNFFPIRLPTIITLTLYKRKGSTEPTRSPFNMNFRSVSQSWYINEEIARMRDCLDNLYVKHETHPRQP